MLTHPTTGSLRDLFVALVLALGLACTASAAPDNFSPTASDGATVSSDVSGTCIGCQIDAPENVISDRRKDAATIRIPVGVLSSARLRVGLPSAEPARSRVGFVVRDVTGLLDLEAFHGLTVRTFLDGAVQDERTVGSALKVRVLSGGRARFFLKSGAPFDAVEIEVRGALALLTELDVTHVNIYRPTSTSSGRVVAEEENGATVSTDIGGICVGCRVDDSDRAVDGDLGTGATARVPIGVAGSVALTVDYAADFAAGSRTGFHVGSTADLLDLSVLSSVELVALSDGEVVDQASGSELDVVQRPDGLAHIRFTPSAGFDAVQIRLRSVVGLSLEVSVRRAVTIPAGGGARLDLAAAPPQGLRVDPAASADAIALGVPAPHPVVGSSRLTVRVRDGGAIRVAVYDALGREVGTLHDGTLAEGEHALRFDAGGLAPGTYVVRAAGDAAGHATQVVTVGR